MIDSVVLKLNEGQFRVLDDKYFDGKETKQVSGKFFVTAAFSNQAQTAKRAGCYFPRITLPDRTTKRADGTKEQVKTLEIQASLPKLKYGTNALEVDRRDLEPLYFALAECLAKVHIRTTTEDLKSAMLKRVDFSKVIRLPDYLGQAKQVIKLLSNFDYKPSSEFTYKAFNNTSEGTLLKFWNNTQGYSVYDKFAEILTSGYTEVERAFIEQIKQDKLKRNVIKFELSLERKQSLEAVLRRFITGKKKDFTLGDIMASTDISKAVLLETFDKVFNRPAVGMMTLAQMQDNRLEQYLLEKNLPLAQHALIYYLVNMTTRIGVSGMWGQLRQRVSGTSYDRYREKIGLTVAELGQLSGDFPSLITYLRQQHEKFELLRI